MVKGGEKVLVEGEGKEKQTNDTRAVESACHRHPPLSLAPSPLARLKEELIMKHAGLLARFGHGARRRHHPPGTRRCRVKASLALAQWV